MSRFILEKHLDYSILACNAGHYEIVEFLIKNNANVHIQSTSGNTALHYASAGVCTKE